MFNLMSVICIKLKTFDIDSSLNVGCI